MTSGLQQPLDHRAARRQLVAVLAGCVLGAGTALVAAGQAWARGTAAQGQVRLDFEVSGSAQAPVVPALALAGLAGVLALLATRGRIRRLCGALVGACGLGVALGAALRARPQGGDLAGRAGDALGVGSAAVLDGGATLWPWPAALGGALLALAGFTAAARGHRWVAMSARYDAPGAAAPARESTVEETSIEAWRALDRGEDPTA